MIFGALIGAGASLLGSALKGKKSKKNAQKAEFQPFSITGSPLGSVQQTRQGANFTETGFNQGARGFFQDQFNQFAGDPQGQQQFGQGLIGQGQQQFGGAFQDAQNAGFDFSNQGVGNFLQQTGLLGQQFGNIGQQGINAAFGGPSAAGSTAVAQQAAGGLLGQAGNFNQLAADRTAQLNQLAGPGEQTATNQKFQSLFGQGRLGTTGGAQALGQLQQAQQRAGTERGLAGMNFAQQQQNQLLGQAQGFLGLGQQGIGLDQNQAANLGQLGAGFLQRQPGLAEAGLGAAVGMDQRNISRGAQRLQNVQGLFGFGQEQQQQPVANASRTLGAIDPLNQNLLNLNQQALQGAGISSGAGANAAQIAQSGGSGFASAIQGLGSGLFNRGVDKFFT